MSCKVITGILCLLLVHATLEAQSFASDLDLIRSQGTATSGNTGYYTLPQNNRAVMETHRQTVAARYNPVTLVLKGTMFVYQHVISPQLSRSCPYEITCSNFSKLSIREYGLVKGVFLSADRILRCNRIGILDVHPLDFNEWNGKISDPPNKYQ